MFEKHRNNLEGNESKEELLQEREEEKEVKFQKLTRLTKKKGNA